MTALQIVGGVFCVVAGMWVLATGTIGLLDKGKLSDAPMVDGGKLASLATVKEEYERRVAAQHRFYLRLHRGFPWATGVLILGVILVIIGSH
jgi:hypothetical protein